MNLNEILTYCHQSIYETNKEYHSWTGYFDVTDHGVENYVTGNIAKYIMGKSNNSYPKYAALESHLNDYTDCVSGVCGRQKKELDKNLRIDLTLYNSDYKPIYAIEVKRKWDNTSCKKDIDRLYSLVKKYGRSNAEGSSLYGGIFLCIFRKSYYNDDDNIIDNYEDTIIENVYTAMSDVNNWSLKFAKELDIKPFKYNYENDDGETMTRYVSSFSITIK